MARAFKSECYNTNSRRIAGILTDLYNKILEPAEVNVAQFCLLRNLERIGSGNLTEWAEATGIERTTMVRNAKALAEAGLICLTEGRGRVYRLSDKGVETIQKALPLWTQAQGEVAELLGEEDAAALIRIGKKVQLLS